MLPRTLWTILIALLLTPITGICQKSRNSLLLCRPIDAGNISGKVKNQWAIALLDRQVRFRLEPIRELATVTEDTLAKLMPELYRFDKNLSAQDYKNAVARTGATHLLDQKFEILQHGKGINYYAEIVTTKNKTIVTQVERDIPLDNLSRGIDSCLSQLVQKLGIELSTESIRFFDIPIASNNYRNIRSLGELIALEHDKQATLATIGRDYEKMIEKDPLMLLANYSCGKLYFKTGEYDKAARYLKELLELTPIHRTLYITLGQSYRLNNRFNEALQVAKQCENSRLKTVPFLLEKALALEGLGQSGAAFSTHQQVLSLDSSQTISLLFLAHLRNNERNFEAGKLFAEKLLVTDPQNGSGYYELGRSYLALNNYKQAEKALSTAVRILPEDPAIQELLGDLSIINRQNSQAITFYRHASTMRPLELDLYLKTATALSLDGKHEEALKSLYTIVGRFPSKPQLRRQIGLLEYETGSLDSASRSLTMFLAIKPTDSEVLIKLADTYAQMEKYKVALDYYNKALPVAVDKIACRLAIAAIELKTGNRTGARTLLAGILAEKPVKSANFLMGEVLASENKPKDALKSYSKERELHGNNVIVQEKIAQLHYNLGFYIPARKEFNLLLELAPNSATACYHLALLHLRSGEITAAEKFLAQARVLGNGSAPIFYELGDLFYQKKEIIQAIDAFKSCLQLDPGHRGALEQSATCYLARNNDTAAADIEVQLFKIDNNAYTSRLSHAGHLYFKNKRFEKAESAFALFIEKGFSDFSVNASYAVIAYDKHDYPKVITLLRGMQDNFAKDEQNLTMLADAYCNTSNYSAALPLLKKIRGINQNSPIEARLSAIASEQTGDTATAIAMYERLVEFPPDNNHAQYSFHLAALYALRGDFKHAVSQYEATLKEEPENLAIHEQLAIIYMQEQEWKQAQRVLEAAIEFPNAGTVLQKMLAQTYVQTNNMKRAASIYTAYLIHAKEDFAAWKELATLYYKQNNFAESIKPLQQATLLQPANFDCWLMLGSSYCGIDRFSDAIAPLGRARTLDRLNIAAIEQTARCYRHLGETSTLTAILREWTAIDPKRYDIKMELGSILLDEKDLAEATEMLIEAARFIPSEPQPHLLLAKAYEMQGFDSLCNAELTLALKFGPDNWQTHYQLARYLLAHKLGHDAELHLQKTIALNPAFSSAHFEYGSYLLALHQYPQAEREFSLAAENEPDNALFMVHLAYANSLINNDKRALEILSVALGKALHNPQVLYWAGLVYNEVGQKEVARQTLQEALAIENNCAECLEALGDIAMEEIHFTDASKLYFKSWEMGGYNESRAYKLGKSLFYDRKFLEAKDFFETILAKKTGYDEATFRLIATYCELDEIKKAHIRIADFTGKGTPWMQLAQGTIYEKEHNYEAALIAYGIAGRLAPDNSEVAAGIGRVYLATRQFDSALVFLSKASAADSLNIQAMVDLGTLFESTGDPVSAFLYYTEVDKRYPVYPDIQLRMAKIKTTQNAHEIAIRILKRGIEYHPENTDLHFLLGKELERADEYALAVESYKTALKKGKGHPIDAFKLIGNIYYDKMTNSKKAISFYKKYLRAGGEDTVVAQRLTGS